MYRRAVSFQFSIQKSARQQVCRSPGLPDQHCNRSIRQGITKDKYFVYKDKLSGLFSYKMDFYPRMYREFAPGGGVGVVTLESVERCLFYA